jgi:hypothetical protein
MGVKKTTQQEAQCSVLLTKYNSGDQIEKPEMGRACSTCGKRRGSYRVLVEKTEGKNST